MEITLTIILFWIIIYLLILLINRYLLSRTNNNKKLKIAVLSFLLAIVAYGCYYRIFIYSITYEKTEKFSKEKWNTEVNERWKMKDDIINSKLLIGKDSLTVKNLLGKPTTKDSLNNLWAYQMGQGSQGFGVVFYTLKINYVNGLVSAVESSKIND